MRPVGVLLLAGVPVLLAATLYGLGPADAEAHGPVLDASRAGSATADGTPSPSASASPSASPSPSGSPTLAAATSRPAGLTTPAEKEIAQEIVASAENSTLDWRSAYAYIEDIGDGQGYTAGLIGFCTGTHDLLELVEGYTAKHPGNGLARYLPALRRVDGSDSHDGLDPGFPAAWRAEARVPAFRAAQDAERDRLYFDPAVRAAEQDGLGTLGQFVYYDAMVYHGQGTVPNSFGAIRATALRHARTPAQGGGERAYLNAFLDARRAAMLSMHPGVDTSRVTAQRRFLREGNLGLRAPLTWQMYGETYHIP